MHKMALFEQKKEPGSYELIREGDEVILRIDADNLGYPPSLEDSGICMSETCDKLIEAGRVTKIVFSERRDYEYDYGQTQILYEIAQVFSRLVKEKTLFAFHAFTAPGCARCPDNYVNIKNIVFQSLKSDPLGCYVQLKRLARSAKLRMEKEQELNCLKCHKQELQIIEYILGLLDSTKLLALARNELTGFKVGNRDVYRKIFSPSIKPDFMYTKLTATYPVDAEELDSYTIGDNTEVTIFSIPDTIQYLYHMVPPEFKLTEEKYEILDMARKILSEHKPTQQEFIEPTRTRQIFVSVGKDLIEELASFKGVKLREKEINELANILVRYTIGFGLIELLLQDDKVQDVTINSPMGKTPIFIVHSEFSDCRTNIVPTTTESESWASKLRLISGRPLDEANPILDTELEIPGASARIAVISPPLNPTGLAYAFRRHRDKPWTLPLFIHQRMINPLGAGVISFLVDGARTLLVAGTRSAGKTSLLSSIMVEIMRKYRIITIEDTLELPTSSLKNLGYNIQSMKVASAMTKGTTEVSADEGIRTTLRMGDSSLIVGEVRSTEARALYEAMRVGALANVVAGTIHGDSPYGVYDRVVNDLRVPRTSFKATDIVIVANPIKSADGLHRWRRVTQITEVRKHWEKDPMLEHGFVDLLKYDPKTDELQPSQDLINGDSDVLKSIAGNVKDWAGNWDAVWDNIMLRTRIKKALVDFAEKTNNLELLEAPFVIAGNDEFHRISDMVKDETGALDSERIYFEWIEWMRSAAKKFGPEQQEQQE